MPRHLMRPRLGRAQALCEFLSPLHRARTRLEERLIAQLLGERQHALAQEPHVLRVLRPHLVHRLAYVQSGRQCWHVCHALTCFYAKTVFI